MARALQDRNGGSGTGVFREWVEPAYGEEVELLHARSICGHGAVREEEPGEDFAANDRHRTVPSQHGQEEALTED
jgi:hypothetical protein